MSELKWVEGIVTGMNTPDVSGYAIVTDGIVESYPIQEEFNGIIKQTLDELAALRSENERLKEQINQMSSGEEWRFLNDRIQRLTEGNNKLKQANRALVEALNRIAENTGETGTENHAKAALEGKG